MSPRQQAILYRFFLGLMLGEIPALNAFLSSPTPDYRLLGIGLLTGLGAALEKYLAPQLVTTDAGAGTLKAGEPAVQAVLQVPTSAVIPTGQFPPTRLSPPASP